MDEKEVSAKTKVAGFLNDVRTEFGKISWPTRKELTSTTWIVGAMILLVAGIVLVFDQVLINLLGAIIQQ